MGHVHGHQQVSSDMAKEILARLKYDNDTIKTVTQLVLYHDINIQADSKIIKRRLNKIGEEQFRRLIEVKRADMTAHAKEAREKGLFLIEEILSVLDEIIAQQQCFSLKDLAVNGRDLIAAGVPQGAQIGVVLNKLMDMVIDEIIENDKAVLLKKAIDFPANM